MNTNQRQNNKPLVGIFNRYGTKLIIAILVVSFVLSILTMLTVFIGLETSLSPDKSSIQWMIEFWKDSDPNEADAITAVLLNFWWLIIIAGIPYCFCIFSLTGLVALAIANAIEGYIDKQSTVRQNNNQPIVRNNTNQINNMNQVNNAETVNLNKEQNNDLHNR